MVRCQDGVRAKTAFHGHSQWHNHCFIRACFSTLFPAVHKSWVAGPQVLLSGALTAESAVGAAAEVLDDDAVVEGAEKVPAGGLRAEGCRLCSALRVLTAL